MRRTIIVLLAVLAIALAATADAVFSRYMDGWPVACLALVAALAAIVTVVGLRSLIQAFLRRELRSTFDQLYWLLLVILPFSAWVSGAAVVALCWYFFERG